MKTYWDFSVFDEAPRNSSRCCSIVCCEDGAAQECRPLFRDGDGGSDGLHCREKGKNYQWTDEPLGYDECCMFFSKRAAVMLGLTFALPALGEMERRWAKQYNGPSNNTDAARAVIVDQKGDVIITGVSLTSLSNFDVYTAKYAGGDGKLLWERPAAPSGLNDELTALALDSGGNIVAAGYSGSGGTQARFYLAKYAANDGALLWEKSYTGGTTGGSSYHRFATGVAVDHQDNVVFTGLLGTVVNSDDDMYTAKLNGADGALIWEKRWNGPAGGSDSAKAVAVDAHDNVIVAGRSQGTGTSFDCYTAKYAGYDGDLLRERRYNGPVNGADGISAIALDAGDNVIVAGVTKGIAGTAENFYVAKYASGDGKEIWARTDGGKDFEDTQNLVLDADGNAIVSGWTTDAFITQKYAALNGATLWAQFRNGGYGGNGIALAPNGDVFAAGTSSFPETDEDIYVVRYAGGDGAVLWEDRYNGPANDQDSVAFRKGVAATREGGFVVTGATRAANSDILTLCYGPTTTALETWRKQNFGTTLGSGDAADNADPDCDGLPNLIEWACGLNPWTAAAALNTPSPDGADFTFVYSRSKDALIAGAAFTVEWSDTLAGDDWHTEGVREVVLSGEDGPVESVRAAFPGAAKRFARLRVAAPR